MAIAAALFAASCGGSSSSSGSSASSESISGQTITVLVPYVMPQSLLNQFTKETGEAVWVNPLLIRLVHASLAGSRCISQNLI